MSRLTDAVLQTNTAYASGQQNPMLDLKYGGQMGHSPDYTEWVSNAAYVRRNLICVLVEAPKGFQYLPNPEYWVATLRALVEMHPMSIDGLSAGLTVDVAENAVGGAGQMQQDVTDVKEERSNPVFNWNEKYGMPISAFLRGWITNLLMDPYTKFANVNTLAGNKPSDMLPDMYAATMLFMEPDPQHQKVVKAWLCTNMFPLGTGEITGRRDLTAAGETPALSINFSALTQYGLGVNAFAQQVLNGMTLTGANPFNRAAFVDRIGADILATRKSYGQGIQDLANGAIRV